MHSGALCVWRGMCIGEGKRCVVCFVRFAYIYMGDECRTCVQERCACGEICV
jgi:hypothetical protein